MRIHFRPILLTICIASAMPCASWAIDNSKMLDLQAGNQRLTGRILKHNDQFCWFLGRDGRLQQLSMPSVTSFVEVGEQFKPNTSQELKFQLKREFGKENEVFTTRHYVVVARQGMAEKYANLMEQIYREFVRSFRGRGFRLNEPEFPLVAIVFRDESAFAKYCEGEKAQVRPGMVGFYLPTSNRVAMYERSSQGDVDQTVIHEATHQVAFNTGIHQRLANHPRWVVEGLATVFEADGIRSRQGTTTPADRVNRERFLWFQDYVTTRRVQNSLEQFLSDDELFDSSPLDAYCEAWAISFFLIETKPTQYARYLKRLVERESFTPYVAVERVNDFKEQFGKDLSGLESTYLKFIKRLKDN